MAETSVFSHRERAIRLVAENLDEPNEAMAQAIEASPPRVRDHIWGLLDSEKRVKVLVELRDDLLARFLDQTPIEDLKRWGTDDKGELVRLVRISGNPEIRQLLEELDPSERQSAQTILQAPEGSAGALAHPDYLSVRGDINVDVAIRYVRAHQTLPASTKELIVTTRSSRYVGILPLSRLLTADDNLLVSELTNTQIEAVPMTATLDEAEQELDVAHDISTLAVVSDAGKVVGRLVIDDLLEARRDEVRKSNTAIDPDTFAPHHQALRSRIVWLCLNLITAVIASFTVAQFEEVIKAFAAVAILMPIVSSMGGIAATQTLMMMERADALSYLTPSNYRWLWVREVYVAWGAATAVGIISTTICLYWLGDDLLSLLLGAAMGMNLLIASCVGFFLPTILKRLKLDVSLAGSVVATTITDVTGFVLFLGLATKILL